MNSNPAKPFEGFGGWGTLSGFNVFHVIVPQGSRKLEPWARISQRLRRISKLNQYSAYFKTEPVLAALARKSLLDTVLTGVQVSLLTLKAKTREARIDILYENVYLSSTERL
jgi:hypothetical protein